MNELIAAAKAVIDTYEYTGTAEECEAVNRLHEAVERAEKQEAVGFEEWYRENIDGFCGLEIYDCAKSAWQDAQQAESERIRVSLLRLSDEEIALIFFNAGYGRTFTDLENNIARAIEKAVLEKNQ